MAHNNAAVMTTTTSGTGALTLSAVTGAPTFLQSVGDNFRMFPYSIVDPTTGYMIECGQGYLSSSGTILNRAKIEATYVSGTYDDTSPAAVSLPGTTVNVVLTNTGGSTLCAWPGSLNFTNSGAQLCIASAHLTHHNAISAAVTLSANIQLLIPFDLRISADIDAIGIRVGTGAASSNVILGIYNCSAVGAPERLIAQTASLATATSSTDVWGTITQTRLNPGAYWVSLVANGAPAVGCLDVGGSCRPWLGSGTGNLMSSIKGYQIPATFGVLQPFSNLTGAITITGSTNIPTIFLRPVA